MPRMYHPNLPPPNNEIDVPDDPGCVRVHTESGWELAPEPTSTSPALAPTVIYEPAKVPVTKPRSKSVHD